MTIGKLSASAIALTVLCTVNCFGGIITYTNEATWSAAVSGNYVTEPFNAGGLQPFTGVVTSEGAIGGARGLLSGSVWTDRVTAGESTTWTYEPGALIGAGATFDTSPANEGNGLQLTLNLVGGGTESVAQIGPIDDEFFGFVSTDAFTSFTVTPGTNAGSAETYDMDNLDFAAQSRAPEPGSVLLLSSGLLGFALLRKKLSF